jgi:hypothetical protein
LDEANLSKIWLGIDPPPLVIAALNYRVLSLLWLVARNLARDREDIKTGFNTSALSVL